MAGTSSIANMMNSRLRMSGLSSGIDTESMIEQLMKIEQLKVDRVKQERQILEWKRDDYRSISSLLKGFTDEFLSVLKPESNFRSSAAFSAFGVVSSDTNSAYFSAKAGAGAVPGNYNVVVKALASAPVKTGTEGISAGTDGMTGTNVTISAMKKGKQFNITLNGTTKTITLDRDYSSGTAAALAGDANGGLQKLINDAFGTGKINVTESGGHLTFAPTVTSSTITIADNGNTYLGTLGFSDGQSNSVISSDKITDFTGGNFKVQLDSDTAVPASVASASDIGGLVANINTGLANAGLGASVKAVLDPEDGQKIRLVSLDTSKKAVLTAGDSDDMLAKVKLSNGSTVNPLQGAVNFENGDLGRDFYITIDGTKHHIDLSADYADETSTVNGRTLAQEIQYQLQNDGVTDVNISISEGKMSIANPSGHLVEIEKGDDGLRDELGFTSNQAATNKLNLNETILSLSTSNASQAGLVTAFNLGENNKLDFTINNVSFSIDSSKTLNDVINEINKSSAGVKLRYDNLNDKFVMESKATGAATVIDNSDADNFFAAIGIKTTAQEDGAAPLRGTDALISIDGTDVSRDSNSFTVSGITFDLKAADAGKTFTLTVNSNPDALLEKIKGFVNKYNEMLDTINKELSEKRERDYAPLTDEQKEAMEDSDIKKWEEKAKSGMLNSDSTLSAIVDSLRKALYTAVDGVPVTLSQIGITTGSFEQKGKLVINETKLKEAITNNYDSVVRLFTSDPEYSYNEALDDGDKKSARYKQAGLAERLNDIIQDNIRTTRNKNGQKGALLEKAGIVGDLTEFDSSIVNQIEEKDSLITKLIEKMNQKENDYYIKFTAMEKALSQMNSQSAWLSSQFGGGGG